VSRRKPSVRGPICFEVYWLDEPIESFHLAGDIPLNVGVWYERREAARFALYNWTEFRALPDGEQAAVVAHYRTNKRIEALVADYQSKQSKVRVG
jgi:hypothetical protein